MAKSSPRKNLSELSDLPYHIIRGSTYYRFRGVPYIKDGAASRIFLGVNNSQKKSEFGFSRNSNVKVTKLYFDNFCCHKFKARFLRTSYFCLSKKIYFFML